MKNLCVLIRYSSEGKILLVFTNKYGTGYTQFCFKLKKFVYKKFEKKYILTYILDKSLKFGLL